MWRGLLRWFGLFFVAGVCCLSTARADDAVPPDPTQVEKKERTPALPYTVAALATLLILVILCMPTRKS